MNKLGSLVPKQSKKISNLMAATHYAVVLVTAPDLRTARRLAKFVLDDRLVACVNLVPKMESHYWWKGKIESGGETLLIMKTRRSKLAKLEKTIKSRHPYETPEFLVLPLQAGSKAYLGWISKNC
jgi:periplasmic divalent cation tolerance protein